MPENIDEEFFKAMWSIGGLRPADINPAAGQTLNADVVFPNKNTIIEFKTLMTDPSEHADHSQKVSAVYNRWVGRPGVPIIHGRRTISSADVPPEMALELVRTLADPIRRAVTKANRQIREVKASLNMPGAHGVLLLCNAGATTLTPHVIVNALHHALANRHSSINSAIFMTHGVPVHVPSVPRPVEVFSFVKRLGYEPLSENFRIRIQNAWMQNQARKKTIRVYTHVGGSELMNAANSPICQA